MQDLLGQMADEDELEEATTWIALYADPEWLIPRLQKLKRHVFDKGHPKIRVGSWVSGRLEEDALTVPPPPLGPPAPLRIAYAAPEVAIEESAEVIAEKEALLAEKHPEYVAIRERVLRRARETQQSVPAG